MKKSRITALPMIVVVAVVALVVGTFGTAQASGLSSRQVKKLVAKIVDKKASSLSVAKAANADNADKLDGLDATSLVRVTGTSSATDIDNFNGGAYTTILSKVVTAPVGGLLEVSGGVNWARDFGNGAGVPGVLQARVTVDGVPATIDFGATDDDTAGYGNTIPVDGILSVGAGNHTVALQIREVGAGNSFIYGSQFNTLFTPFGNAGGQGQIGRPDSSDGSAQPQG
jgi:hypothetical protein